MTQPDAPRVLVVTNMWPSSAAPMAGIFVAEQVDSLARHGIHADVLYIDGATGGWRAYLAGFGRVRGMLHRSRYDLIHAHYVFSGVMALGGAALAHQRHVPVVVTQHGIETQVGWTAPLCRWTSRWAAATIATSRRVQAALRRPDAAVIPCGVDMALFRPMPAAEARAALGLPVEARLVLFAGMRRPEKRFDLVEAALARLTARGQPAQLVIAEHEAHERMPLYMNACDVLVLASEAEGSPMVVKEALACNLPIVSVDVGDVAEVTAGIPGCAIVPRDAEALADGLAAALAFGGRTAGRAAIEHLSLEAIAARIVALYGEVIARARPAARPDGGNSGWLGAF